MALVSSKIILRSLIALSLILSMVIGYMYIRHRNERNALNQKLQDMTDRNNLLQEKYQEQKALNAAMMRAKMNLEGQGAILLSKVKDLEKQYEDVLAEKNALGEELNKKVLPEKSRLELELKETKRQFGEASAQHKQEAKQLNDKNEYLQSKLEKCGKNLGQCEKNNAELCRIGNELLKQYEDKSLWTSLTEKEPLTQIQKVKLEKFMEEYKEKIENQQIPEKKDDER